MFFDIDRETVPLIMIAMVQKISLTISWELVLGVGLLAI